MRVAPTVVRSGRFLESWFFRTIVGVRSTRGPQSLPLYQTEYASCAAHTDTSPSTSPLQKNHTADQCRYHPRTSKLINLLFLVPVAPWHANYFNAKVQRALRTAEKDSQIKSAHLCILRVLCVKFSWNWENGYIRGLMAVRAS